MLNLEIILLPISGFAKSVAAIYVGDNAHLYCPECENDFKMVFAHFGCPPCLQYGYENVVKFDPGIPHSYQELAFTGACMVHSPMWIKNFVEELVKQP